jgi:hypothetical protein
LQASEEIYLATAARLFFPCIPGLEGSFAGDFKLLNNDDIVSFVGKTKMAVDRPESRTDWTWKWRQGAGGVHVHNKIGVDRIQVILR